MARLSPGHPQTLAVRPDARRAPRPGPGLRRRRALGRSATSTTSRGARTPTRRSASSTAGGSRRRPRRPDPRASANGAAQEADVTDPVLRSNWRGLFTWYSIPENAYDQNGFGPIVSPATAADPGRRRCSPSGRFTTTREQDQPLDLLDLYFDPTRRGPYNYNRGLTGGAFTQQPAGRLGRVRPPDRELVLELRRPEQHRVRRDPGRRRSAGRNGTEAIAPGARMFLDLGRVNEDVLPNGFLNSEDGLQNGDQASGPELDAWGRRPTGRTNGFVDYDGDTQRTEDLGLDGLPSRRDLSPVAPYAVSRDRAVRAVPQRARAEHARAAPGRRRPLGRRLLQLRRPALQRHGPLPLDGQRGHHPGALRPLLARPRAQLGAGPAEPERQRARHLGHPQLGGHQRQQHARPGRVLPPLRDPARPGRAGVEPVLPQHDRHGRTHLGPPQTWYLLRIPVRTAEPEADGRSTSTTTTSRASRPSACGRRATTSRPRCGSRRSSWSAASGSSRRRSGSWRRAPATTRGDDGPGPQLFIESVNNEENASIYAIPQGDHPEHDAGPRAAGSGATREQALVFRAEGLADGRRAGLARSYATRPLDLTKYSNLRTSIHGDGFERERLDAGVPALRRRRDRELLRDRAAGLPVRPPRLVDVPATARSTSRSTAPSRTACGRRTWS